MKLNKKTERNLAIVFFVVLAVYLLYSGSFSNEAAIQRKGLVSDLTTPQQANVSLFAFNLLIPLIAAYYFFIQSKPSLTFIDIWDNLGAKVGLLSGLSTIFIFGRAQIFLFVVAILFMMSFGYWLGRNGTLNLLSALLIPFALGYYFTLILILRSSPLQLISFFNALSVTVFLWVVPLIVALIVYSFYRGYIPILQRWRQV